MRNAFEKMRWGACVGIATLLIGCSTSPVEELMQAESALQRAQAAGAEDYAADTFKSAAEAMADARSKNERKDFEGARVAAVDAKAKADLASAVVVEGKAHAKEQVEIAIATERGAWTDVTVTVSKMTLATVNKEKMADLTIRIESLLSNIKFLFDAGDFASALDLTIRVEGEIGQARLMIASIAAEK